MDMSDDHMKWFQHFIVEMASYLKMRRESKAMPRSFRVEGVGRIVPAMLKMGR